MNKGQWSKHWAGCVCVLCHNARIQHRNER